MRKEGRSDKEKEGLKREVVERSNKQLQKKKMVMKARRRGRMKEVTYEQIKEKEEEMKQRKDKNEKKQ